MVTEKQELQLWNEIMSPLSESGFGKSPNCANQRFSFAFTLHYIQQLQTHLYVLLLGYNTRIAAVAFIKSKPSLVSLAIYLLSREKKKHQTTKTKKHEFKKMFLGWISSSWWQRHACFNSIKVCWRGERNYIQRLCWRLPAPISLRLHKLMK